MELRLAIIDDLPELKAIYKEIIKNMNSNNIYIWDEIYPCEFFEDDIKTAINLYKKVGFEKVDGIYNEVIDDDLVLHEFGFEIKTSICYNLQFSE